MAIMQIEANLNEKILAESNKLDVMKNEMGTMQKQYEQQLEDLEKLRANSIEGLKTDYDEVINEKEKRIRQMNDEIQVKKEEFFQYCQQLNLDNDRKMAQIKLNYEARQKETNDSLLKWRTDASILTKRIESTSSTCQQLRNDIAILLEEHNRNKKQISQLEQNITELQRDIDSQNKLVNDKEVCLIEAIEKCRNMEKMKQFMNERAIQLEAQIKPLDDQIKECNYKICEMEDLNRKMLWQIDDLNIEINLLRNRCKASTIDFKAEKRKNLRLDTNIKRMNADIAYLAQNIQNLPKLKELTLSMFKK